jgi:hypothetical protein
VRPLGSLGSRLLSSAGGREREERARREGQRRAEQEERRQWEEALGRTDRWPAMLTGHPFLVQGAATKTQEEVGLEDLKGSLPQNFICGSAVERRPTVKFVVFCVNGSKEFYIQNT